MLIATAPSAVPRTPREYPTEWTMYSTREEDTPQLQQRETAPPGAKEENHAPQ